MPRTIKQEVFSSHEDALFTLAAAFPEAVKDGEVDWDTLKEILADAPSTVPEKYELTWTGKAEAKREAGRDVVGRTLRFHPEESKNAETTQNLYIEGDNLEVLKLLRENYYGAIKMIYIDPPYNTGNDFVYRDNFTLSESESEVAEGNIDEEGQRLVKNPKSSNRYHANWLSMIYPRLRLARDLLSQDGVIFISIDDNEFHNLKKICDEIYGEENFIACISWQKRYTRSNNTVEFTTVVEYIMAYSRTSEFNVNLLNRTEEADNRYTNPDNDPRGPWKGASFLNPATPAERPNLCYPITNPNTGMVVSPTTNAWRRSKEVFGELQRENRLYWGLDGKQSIPSIKMFLSDARGLTPINLWTHDYAGNTDQGTSELAELLGGKYFDNPKPQLLIKRILEHGSNIDSIILDFFSGSSTTAQAVMQLNFEDGGHRSFICVQYPEEINPQKTAYSAGYRKLSQIGRERIHRAGELLNREVAGKVNESQHSLFGNKSEKPCVLDIGFKLFRTADTVIRWTHDVLRSGEQMTLSEAAMSDKDRLDFMSGFTDLDVVYEIALRQNDVPLSAPVRLVPEAGMRTYLFADSVLVCLEEAITPKLVEVLAAIQPTPNKFILRDSAFEDDIALKDETLRRLQACVSRNTKDGKSTYVVDFI